MCVYMYIHIYIYIYNLLYINPMVNTHQKTIIDTHTQREKRKESKYNAKDSHQITRGESKRRKEQQFKKLQRQSQNN